VKRSLPTLVQPTGAAPTPVATSLAPLFQSLRDEGDALVGADVDKMAQAVRDKEAALRNLAAELERTDGPELREALARARDLNERNGRLLAPHFRMNQARIESLLGSARTGALYSADGLTGGAEQRPAQRGVRA
jgi:flagellar biosynthesis/type III secretory pathway chaperone